VKTATTTNEIKSANDNKRQVSRTKANAKEAEQEVQQGVVDEEKEEEEANSEAKTDK